MNYIIGIIIGCSVTTIIANIIFAIKRKKTVYGTFNVMQLHDDDAAVWVKFADEINLDTTTIVLKKNSRK